MKPPPRTRTKPGRTLQADPAPQPVGKRACKWQRAEQRKLLNALRRLNRLVGGHGDIDYDFLRKQVPTRSISEIHSVVESLKNKVISCVSFKLKQKRWEDKKVRKAIEAWTHMASAVVGSLDEPITSAFSQMLIVSSTEPRTLSNCDPPQVHRPPTDEEGPAGRTIPLRPMPVPPVQGERPSTDTACPLPVLQTPAPSPGLARTLPALLKVVRVPPQPQPSPRAGASLLATLSSQSAATSAKIFVTPPTTPQSVPQTVLTGQATPSSTAVVKTLSVGSSVIQNKQQWSEQHRPKASITSTHTPLSSSATNLTPVPSTAASSVASASSATSSCSSTHPMPPPPPSTGGFHARFGRTSKYATEDSPRTFGVKCIVDFERIYRYLSVIHKPNEDCHLTPMESAIVLDLLMSLPEELSLLDCKKLHKHLTQVYQCLSSPADSKMAREMMEDLEEGLSEGQQSTTGTGTGTGTGNSSDVTDSGGKTLQPEEAGSRTPGGNKTCSQSGNVDLMGLCSPLNPFIVPLKLLMRR